MKETILCHKGSSEPAAIAVSLEDVKEHLLSINPELIIKIEYDDYDDYGCDHRLTVIGSHADLVFKKDYGGMFCPGNSLDCFVDPRVIRDETTFLKAEYIFSGEWPKTIHISINYADRITEFFSEYSKYLSEDSGLLKKIEYEKTTWSNT
ncbi:MAG: hypothetical protein LV471_09220 [Nitrosomonas sp.]|nr:hypothetical protein [Nitrosomonas sp.]